jgi:hypothetical protein
VTDFQTSREKITEVYWERITETDLRIFEKIMATSKKSSVLSQITWNWLGNQEKFHYKMPFLFSQCATAYYDNLEHSMNRQEIEILWVCFFSVTSGNMEFTGLAVLYKKTKKKIIFKFIYWKNV